jgi:tRNA (mo5U34)-methyltransferase
MNSEVTTTIKIDQQENLNRIAQQIDGFVHCANTSGHSDLATWMVPQLSVFNQLNHGHWSEWLTGINALPMPDPRADVHLDRAAIQVSGELSVTSTELENQLQQFSPWRKGPFSLYGVDIDTEWRSDFKWDRLKDHIADLQGRVVLDVGTGSGYHLWRMLGAGAELALGIEPTLAFVAQFHAVAHLLAKARATVLPMTLEQLDRAPLFDTVFSMGVLYHRRDPLGHLRELSECLRTGGELVLETLVIEGDGQQVLTPYDRYAAMRNIWFIPSVPLLMIWLKRLGYNNIRLVNQEPTSLEEQRATRWTDFRQSLVDFLDPDDSSKTVEGYPAPMRAILLANKS